MFVRTTIIGLNGLRVHSQLERQMTNLAVGESAIVSDSMETEIKDLFHNFIRVTAMTYPCE